VLFINILCTSGDKHTSFYSKLYLHIFITYRVRS